MDHDQTESVSDKPVWTPHTGSGIYQIFIECPEGTIETLNVVSSDNIVHIKHQIEFISNNKYPTTEQTLFFQKSELQETKSLLDSNITKNSTLQLSVHTISIYIETQQRNIISLTVKPNELISDVKKRIQDRTGGIHSLYPIQHQKLFNRLNQQELADNNSTVFLDYGLIENSLLYVISTAPQTTINHTDIASNIDEKYDIEPTQDAITEHKDDLPNGITVLTVTMSDNSTKYNTETLGNDTDSKHNTEHIEDEKRKRQKRPRPRAQTLIVSKSTQQQMREEHSTIFSDSDDETPIKKSPHLLSVDAAFKPPAFDLFVSSDDNEDDNIDQLIKEMEDINAAEHVKETLHQRPQSARRSKNSRRERGSRRSRSRSKSRSKSKKRKKRKSKNEGFFGDNMDMFKEAIALNINVSHKSDEMDEHDDLMRKVGGTTPTYGAREFFQGPNASMMDKINAAKVRRRNTVLERAVSSNNIHLDAATRPTRSQSFVSRTPTGVDVKSVFDMTEIDSIVNNLGKYEQDLKQNDQEKEKKRGRQRGRAQTLMVSKSDQNVMREEQKEKMKDDIWIIDRMGQKEEYNKEWMGLKKMKNGKVNGKTMKGFMESSGLPQSKLGKIWSLADVDKDGKMCFEEFALCVFLMDNAKDGEKLPKRLPSNYVPPFFRGKTAVKSSRGRSKARKPQSKPLPQRPQSARPVREIRGFRSNVKQHSVTPKRNIAMKRRSELPQKTFTEQHSASVSQKRSKNNIKRHYEMTKPFAPPNVYTSQSSKNMHDFDHNAPLRLKNDGSEVSLYSMSSSSESEPSLDIPDHIKKRNLQDARMSAILHEINIDEVHESANDRKAFNNNREQDFDDLFSGFFSDDSDESLNESENTKGNVNENVSRRAHERMTRSKTFSAVSKTTQSKLKQRAAKVTQNLVETHSKKKKKMSLKKLLRICNLSTDDPIYAYFRNTLSIEYANDMVNHSPSKITQPTRFKSTKMRMLLQKISKYVMKKVLNDEWHGIHEKAWKELSTNRLSHVYGQAPIQLIKQLDERELKYKKIDTVYFENELNTKQNSVQLIDNNECFMNKKIYCHTQCIVNVTFEVIPDNDSWYHEQNIILVGAAFYNPNDEKYDSICISDRCGIYRKDTYLTMLSMSNSLFIENRSEITIHIDSKSTECIVKFQHSRDGRLCKNNEREINLDIIQDTKGYIKIFLHQYYGKGRYSIHQMIPLKHKKHKKHKKHRKHKKNAKKEIQKALPKKLPRRLSI